MKLLWRIWWLQEALEQAADDELQADPQRWAPIKAWIKGWRKKNRPREQEDFNDQQMAARALEDNGVDDALVKTITYNNILFTFLVFHLAGN